MIFSKNPQRMIRRPYLFKSFDGQLTSLLDGNVSNIHTLNVFLAILSLDTNELSTDFTILGLYFFMGKSYPYLFVY